MADTPDLTSNSRNDAIQGLRAIAALLVVITHAVLTLLDRGPNVDPGMQLFAYSMGEAGVRIFFLISGYIMTLTTYHEFGQRGATSHFIVRRLIRVVPLYWIATLLYASKLIVTDDAPTLREMVLSFLFIPYMAGPVNWTPVYGLGWTLNYEMLFYALFALALLLPRRLGLIALVGSLYALVSFNSVGIGDHCQPGTIACDMAIVYRSPIVLYFGTGLLLALARRWLDGRDLLPRIRTEYTVGVALVIVAAYAYATVYVLNPGDEIYTVQMWVCIAVTALCAIPRDAASGGLSRRTLLALGDGSYSIYLTHSFIVGPASRIWDRFLGNTFPVTFVILMLVACSILGVMSFHWLEKPTLRFLSARLPANHQRSRRSEALAARTAETGPA